MTTDYLRGYSRGYSASAHWPMHKPPVPPQPLVARLMNAVNDLRDECSTVLATFEANDPLLEQFGPKLDAVDDVMREVGHWLLSKDPPDEIEQLRNCLRDLREFTGANHPFAKRIDDLLKGQV